MINKKNNQKNEEFIGLEESNLLVYCVKFF